MNIKDIAKMAGVSISTVSRVVNGKAGVKPDIREAVQKIIDENNFRPNSVAVNLLKKRTNVIGIVVPVIHSYYARIIDAISDVCIENGYSIMVASSRTRIDEEIQNFHMLLEKQVEGIIYFPSNVTDEHKNVIEIVKKRVPIVMIEGNPYQLDIPNVGLDNITGTKRAIKYFIDNGHKKIGMVRGEKGNWTAEEREQSFRATLKENGIEIREEFFVDAHFSLNSGYRGVYTLYKDKTDCPTALFFCNDTMAIGGLKAFSELGIKVPDDVSVIGFDDIEPVKFTLPALTSVHQDQNEMGRQAANLIMEYLKNGDFKINRVILEQKLVIRESVKKI